MPNPIRLLIPIALMGLTSLVASTAWADDDDARAERLRERGDQVEQRLDRKGDRRERALDRKGDAAERRLDRKARAIEDRSERKADRARDAGREAKARQIEERGERQADRLERRGDARDRQLDRKGQRQNRKLDRAEEAPVPWLLTAASYTGSVEEETVRIDARYDLVVLAEGFVEVPLALAPSVVETATVDGSPVRVLSRKGAHVLVLDRRPPAGHARLQRRPQRPDQNPVPLALGHPEDLLQAGEQPGGGQLVLPGQRLAEQ